VADGNGMAARIELDVSSPGNVAEDSQEFCQVLGGNAGAEGKGLLEDDAILAALFGGVWNDEHHCGVDHAPERAALCGEQGRGGHEVDVFGSQAHVFGGQIGIEGDFQPESGSQLLVNRLYISMKTDVFAA